MKIVVDMNLAPAWVPFLADAGFEAKHWSSLGAVDAPDAVIMAFAAAHACVVLTHDLDFGAMLAAIQGEKPSVVQVRAENLKPEVIGPKVVAALVQMASELAAGALVTIDPNRTRISLLPLQRK